MMNAQIKATQSVAQAEPCPNLADGIVDLHDRALRVAMCGYTKPVSLHQHEAADLAARLRGVSAITDVLMACSCRDYGPQLGDYLQSGLLDALNALTGDALRELETAADRVPQEGGAA